MKKRGPKTNPEYLFWEGRIAVRFDGKLEVFLDGKSEMMELGQIAKAILIAIRDDLHNRTMTIH